MFENIADNDLLGRAVFSSRCAKKAKNLKVWISVRSLKKEAITFQWIFLDFALLKN